MHAADGGENACGSPEENLAQASRHVVKERADRSQSTGHVRKEKNESNAVILICGYVCFSLRRKRRWEEIRRKKEEEREAKSERDNELTREKGRGRRELKDKRWELEKEQRAS